MAGRLCDKVAIITGSSRGIGKGIARAFASEGAKLLLVARDEQVGTRVAEEIGQAGSRMAFCRADVSSLLDVKTMVQVALERTFRTIRAAFSCDYAGASGLTGVRTRRH